MTFWDVIVRYPLQSLGVFVLVYTAAERLIRVWRDTGEPD